MHDAAAMEAELDSLIASDHYRPSAPEATEGVLHDLAAHPYGKRSYRRLRQAVLAKH